MTAFETSPASVHLDESMLSQHICAKRSFLQITRDPAELYIIGKTSLVFTLLFPALCLGDIAKGHHDLNRINSWEAARVRPAFCGNVCKLRWMLKQI